MESAKTCSVHDPDILQWWQKREKHSCSMNKGPTQELTVHMKGHICMVGAQMITNFHTGLGPTGNSRQYRFVSLLRISQVAI